MDTALPITIEFTPTGVWLISGAAMDIKTVYSFITLTELKRSEQLAGFVRKVKLAHNI